MCESLEELVRLAESGLTPYQIQLGNSYLTGRDSKGKEFPQNYLEAKRWLERAHARGAFTATHILGTMYEEGKGMPVDVRKAIDLYELAVSRGAYLPCVKLARMYAHGKGVTRSRQLATKWYRKVLFFEGDVDDEGEMDEAREFLGIESAP